MMRQILIHKHKTKSAKNRKIREGALPPRFALTKSTYGQKKQENSKFLLALYIPEREAEPRFYLYALRPT